MKVLLPAVIATVGLSAAALAQELPAFEEVDTNRDGVISLSEASIVEGLDLASADANQDGVLDRAEYDQLSGQE
jgi:hypothetical protein